jgi:predicted enzyme related to lactoylglutathione lyase
MIKDARYVDTNLVAHDWRALARYYEQVFGCELVPPVRDFAAHEVEAGTGVRRTALQGVHLRLPGHGANGPTIEIFTYSQQPPAVPAAPNRPGFAHIAFAVENVSEAREQVLAAGRRSVGDIVAVMTANGTEITWCCVTDPEGNIIELQATSG